MPRKIKIAYPDDKNVDALQSLGLTRPAAKMLLVLQEKEVALTQKDLIDAGIKQPYIPVAAKELEAFGLIEVLETLGTPKITPKCYEVKPLEQVKKILRHQKAAEYSKALDQLAEVWG